MKRIIAAVLVTVGLAATSWADVTVKQTTGGKGMMGIGDNLQTTTYIKGMKMRSDVVNGDTTRTTVFDVDAQKMYMFDNKKKEADVWDMAAFSAEVGKNVNVSEMRGSVKPNGQTKQIGDKTANGFDMEVSLPATMAGDMKMTVTLAGPVWVVKGAPGTDDYLRFYKSAAEKGWIFSDPRAAKAQPGQAKAMSEMYKQLAATGGIPYEQQMEIKMSGDGPMAGILAKMGGMSMTNTVQSVETGTLADDLFAPPAGYKLKTQK